MSTEVWSSGKKLPITLSDPACIALNNKIYCVGGVSKIGNTISASKKLYILNLVNSTWSTGADMPYSTAYPGCVLSGQKIYCVGGSANSNYKRLQIYDIAQNKWSNGADLPNEREYTKPCLVENKIYCIGDRNGNTPVACTTIDIYDIASNTWDSKEFKSVHYSSCVSIGKDIYCFARGSAATPEQKNPFAVDVYHTETDTWSSKHDSPYSDIYDRTAQLYKNKIYFFTVNQVGTTYTRIYDVPSDSWSTDIGIPTPRGSLATVLAGNKIYCIGGMDSDRKYYDTVDIYTISEPVLTEQFLNSDGTPVLPENTLTPEPGSDYVNTAPRVQGYKRIGHKIDDGEPQSTRTARLENIRQNHTVTFLYEPCDGENCIDYEFIITESYYDVENETFILSDTYEYLDAGEDYRKTAHRLTGYNRVGHRIDDGEAVTTRTAVIDNVQDNHHVFFLYEPCDGENCIDVPGGPGDGENPDPGPGGGNGEGPGDGGNGNGGDGCTCGSECHCEICTCGNCEHTGGGQGPSDGGGSENPGGGNGNGGGDGDGDGNGSEGPGDGGGSGGNGDGDGDGDGGKDGDKDKDKDGNGGHTGGQEDCCCCCKDSCMPTMTINIPIRQCNNRLIKTVAQALQDGDRACCCCCGSGTSTKPSNPEPGDEDDVDDCNDPW